MKETVVTTKVVAELNKVLECFAKKNHSGKFQSGDPDVTGCFMGTAFYIEMKVISGALTLLQANQLQKWRDAGARTYLGIYEPKTKEFMLVSPDVAENWSQFVGPKRVEEMFKSSPIANRGTIRDFDFEEWLFEDVHGG